MIKTESKKIVLGIETSCDETAAAIVREDGEVLSNIVYSQLREHKKYGGVVPEIAARAHIKYLNETIERALEEAGITPSDLSAVAATAGPGLIGGVMVGMMAGKAMACALDIPFLGINHLEAHALTARLTDKIEFPYLMLLVSGGHTQILVAEGLGAYRRWGTTLDDAAGECFDKSAKLMGLPYPGGPELEKIAAECKNPGRAIERFPLPRPMLGRKELDFSFSGLKTSVRQHVEKLPAGDLNRTDIADLACAFQNAMCDILEDRCARAIRQFKKTYKLSNIDQKYPLILCGGVSANKAIRTALESLAAKENMQLFAPPLNLCGDNGAMIAWAGIEYLKAGRSDPLDFSARPRWPLDPEGPPRHGAGVKA